MAKKSQSIKLKNVFIDSNDPMTLQEICKEETKFYNLEKLALEFADREGVSISFSWDCDMPSDEDDEAGDI